MDEFKLTKEGLARQITATRAEVETWPKEWRTNMTTTEKQATGHQMTSRVFRDDDTNSKSWTVEVLQDGRCVFFADGCLDKQHAEQIARDICVRYALIERPTV